MPVADEIEEILKEIGFGRWQWLVLLMTMIMQFICPVEQLGSPLLSAPVPFRCSFPDNNQFHNGTDYGPLSQGEIQYPSICNPEKGYMDMPVAQQSNQSLIVISKRVTGMPSCPEIEYDTSMFQSTVVTEWNLVCEASSLQPLYQMAYPIGALIGSAICGQLSDRLGRKRTLQMGIVIMTLAILGTSAVPWYKVMIALRIVTGLGTIIAMFPAYTLLSEVSPMRYRTITNLACGMSYYVGLAAFAGVGYLQPHWRKLILLSNSPILLVILLTFYIDESPRWLIQRGRATEAVDILRKAVKKNKASLGSSTSETVDYLERNNDVNKTQDGTQSEEGMKSDGITNIFTLVKTCYTSPGMRMIIILSPIMWFLQRSQNVGIVINANNFASPFEYVACSSAMGIIAMAMSIPSNLKVPRRVFLAGTLSTSGVLLLLEMAVPLEYKMIQWVMVMAAFCLSCGAFQINYIYALELYPTSIRTRGFGFNNILGATGEMTIPLVTDIAVRYQWWAASVTFGLGGIIASFLMLFLPETNNLAMPETLQDVEDRYWRRKKVHPKIETTEGTNRNPTSKFVSGDEVVNFDRTEKSQI